MQQKLASIPVNGIIIKTQVVFRGEWGLGHVHGHCLRRGV